jgi:hypothetical protein
VIKPAAIASVCLMACYGWKPVHEIMLNQYDSAIRM